MRFPKYKQLEFLKDVHILLTSVDNSQVVQEWFFYMGVCWSGDRGFRIKNEPINSIRFDGKNLYYREKTKTSQIGMRIDFEKFKIIAGIE